MSQGTVDGFLKDTDVTLAADSNLFVPSQHAVKTYVDNLVATSTPLAHLPGSTYSTVQHLFNFSLSPGLGSGGNITVSGTANAVDVAAGTGFIRAVDSNVSTEYFFDWPALNALSVPLNTTRFIGVEYNGGSPIVFSKTTEGYDLDTEFPLGIAINEGGTIYIVAIPWITGDNMANVIERFDSIAEVSRDNRVGGLILSNTGTRNVMVSASILLSRMSEFTIPPIDTSSVNTFDAYYRNGAGGFTKQSAQTQWNNTQYDDGTGVLATLTAGFYTSRWFYVMTDGSLAMMYGQNNDSTLAIALNDGTPSNTPDRLKEGGILIGRFIIQKSAGTPSTTQTVFGANFSASSVTSFSDLSGFASPSQGGTGAINNNASTLTISGNFPTTLVVTAPTSVTLPTSGTIATLSDNLGSFAATTSAQLASVLTDETGTGAAVFANSPVFTTPNIGVATGSVTGNAGTATALQTPRTINGVSFDGTANITVAAAAGTLTGATLAANVLASSLTSVGTLATLTVTAPIVGSVTGSSGSTTGNAATATALQTARTINGVSFDGTANITVTAAAGTLTGATLAANVLASSLTSVGTLANLTVTNSITGSITGSSGSTTGNAATATALQTARTINGVSFDGTANITVAAAAGTLTGATLAANVLASSLTSVGTLANLTVTNPISGSVTGNAGTATALQTARTIDGISFDGTANITVIAPATHAATSKATPVDADEIPLADSASSFTLKKLTWANLKATLKAYFDTFYQPIEVVFTSADQTITSAGQLTLAHGLASTPHNIQFFLVNQTAEFGYTAGQILSLNGFNQGNNQGAAAVPDATNIVIRMGSAGSAFSVINKTTGASANATNGNWKLRVYARTEV